MSISFQKRIYTLTQSIPAGKVGTYKQLAFLAGSPNAARAVGMCMSKNPDATTNPCHRVVASNGRLTGYAFGDGISTKKKLLLQEGVSLIGDRVDLAISQWNP